MAPADLAASDTDQVGAQLSNTLSPPCQSRAEKNNITIRNKAKKWRSVALTLSAGFLQLQGT